MNINKLYSAGQFDLATTLERCCIPDNQPVSSQRIIECGVITSEYHHPTAEERTMVLLMWPSFLKKCDKKTMDQRKMVSPHGVPIFFIFTLPIYFNFGAIEPP